MNEYLAVVLAYTLCFFFFFAHLFFMNSQTIMVSWHVGRVRSLPLRMAHFFMLNWMGQSGRHANGPCCVLVSPHGCQCLRRRCLRSGNVQFNFSAAYKYATLSSRQSWEFGAVIEYRARLCLSFASLTFLIFLSLSASLVCVCVCVSVCVFYLPFARGHYLRYRYLAACSLTYSLT